MAVPAGCALLGLVFNQLSHVAVVAGALGADIEAAPTAWPQGCLGYAFNLVRPTRAGDRAHLLYNMLGHTIVFRTLAEASAYRLDIAKVTKSEL